MNIPINPNNSMIFLLQKEYLRECDIQPVKNEDGSTQKNDKGQEMMKAVHPNGMTFPKWLEFNNLVIQQQSKIIGANGQPADKSGLKIIP